MREITIIDVARSIGIEPKTALVTAAGQIVRDMYEKEKGVPPEKKLRRKTSGHGSYCLAVYPETWSPRMAKVLRSLVNEPARQMSLF